MRYQKRHLLHIAPLNQEQEVILWQLKCKLGKYDIVSIMMTQDLNGLREARLI